MYHPSCTFHFSTDYPLWALSKFSTDFSKFQKLKTSNREGKSETGPSIPRRIIVRGGVVVSVDSKIVKCTPTHIHTKMNSATETDLAHRSGVTNTYIYRIKLIFHRPALFLFFKIIGWLELSVWAPRDCRYVWSVCLVDFLRFLIKKTFLASFFWSYLVE